MQSGIAPNRVTIEVTESAVTADASRAQAVLESLARNGVRIAIDDFGTGYTSLSQVGQLPVHELKVDKTFVLGMLTDHTKRAIVASIVELGRSLGLDVVAEGAETSKHWEMLRALGMPHRAGLLRLAAASGERVPALAGGTQRRGARRRGRPLPESYDARLTPSGRWECNEFAATLPSRRARGTGCPRR